MKREVMPPNRETFLAAVSISLAVWVVGVFLITTLAGCGRGGSVCPRPPSAARTGADGLGGGTCQVMR